MDLEAYRYQWRRPKESEVEDSQLVAPRVDTTPLAFDQPRGDSVNEVKGGDSVSEAKKKSVNDIPTGSVNESIAGSVNNPTTGNEVKEAPTNQLSLNTLEKQSTDVLEKSNPIPKEMSTEVVYTSFSEVLNAEKERSKKANSLEQDRIIAATSLEREKRLLEVSQEVLSPVTARPPASLATNRLGGLTKSMISWGTGLRSGRRVEKIDLTGEEKRSTRVSLTELDSDEEEK